MFGLFRIAFSKRRGEKKKKITDSIHSTEVTLDVVAADAALGDDAAADADGATPTPTADPPRGPPPPQGTSKLAKQQN